MASTITIEIIRPNATHEYRRAVLECAANMMELLPDTALSVGTPIPILTPRGIKLATMTISEEQANSGQRQAFPVISE